MRSSVFLYPPIYRDQGVLELDFGPAAAMIKLACHTFFYLGGIECARIYFIQVSVKLSLCKLPVMVRFHKEALFML